VDSLHGRTAVLYDPFPLWLDAVEKAVLGGGLTIRGKATDFSFAETLIDECEPDILVAENVQAEAEPGSHTWIRDLLERHPELKVIVLSSRDHASERDSAFAAGAAAYVLKSAHAEDIILAARQVFDQSIAFAHSSEPISNPASGTTALAATELTPREIEILHLVAEGHSNSKLARMLWVTEQTVKFHLSNIYRKLEVANRTEASRWAQVNGLLPSVAPQQAA
jgi:DNA-binding NarL/FixJ family response regulator